MLARKKTYYYYVNMTYDPEREAAGDFQEQVDAVVEELMPGVQEGIAVLAGLGVSDEDAGRWVLANLALRIGLQAEVSAMPATDKPPQDDLSAADVARLLGLSPKFVESWGSRIPDQ